jgi:hypothetical protein
VRLEGLSQLRNPLTSSGIELLTFRLVAQRYRVSPTAVKLNIHNCKILLSEDESFDEFHLLGRGRMDGVSLGTIKAERAVFILRAEK